MYWRSGKAVYLQVFRFWRRIFAVGFAIGVVAGVVITFEMGLNWGGYAAKTGPIIGPILGMEVVTAFAVEASFIHVLLYGDGRVRRSTMFIATVMVSIGTILSSTWIIAANSWMQTPAGYQIVNGQYEPTNWLKVIFNPSFVWRWWHMVGGVLLSAAFLVAGISAWYLRKGRANAFARRWIALGVAAIAIPVQIYLGDAVAGHELPLQPSKVEALDATTAFEPASSARRSPYAPRVAPGCASSAPGRVARPFTAWRDSSPRDLRCGHSGDQLRSMRGPSPCTAQSVSAPRCPESFRSDDHPRYHAVLREHSGEQHRGGDDDQGAGKGDDDRRAGDPEQERAGRGAGEHGQYRAEASVGSGSGAAGEAAVGG